MNVACDGDCFEVLVNGDELQRVMGREIWCGGGKVMLRHTLSATVGLKYYLTRVMVEIRIWFSSIQIQSRSRSAFGCRTNSPSF